MYCNVMVLDRRNELPLEDRHLLKTLEVIAFELKTNEAAVTVAR